MRSLIDIRRKIKIGDIFTINSPLTGTFYTSTSPDDLPFVEEGQSANPGDVVCIVESMKVFIEVRAERKGVICKRLVENEDPIMIHQPLFEVEAA